MFHWLSKWGVRNPTWKKYYEYLGWLWPIGSLYMFSNHVKKASKYLQTPNHSIFGWIGLKQCIFSISPKQILVPWSLWTLAGHGRGQSKFRTGETLRDGSRFGKRYLNPERNSELKPWLKINGLEDEISFWEWPIFRGKLAVSFREWMERWFQLGFFMVTSYFPTIVVSTSPPRQQMPTCLVNSLET